jgi:hypothetical protein
MTLDQRIAHAAARVAVAWSNMDDDQAAEWQAEVERLMDLRDRRDHHRATRVPLVTFDVLKGSPDHSVVRHA